MALVLLPPATACTQNIGGSSSGWNALAVHEDRIYVGTKQGEIKELIVGEGGRILPGWTFPSSGAGPDLEGVYQAPVVVDDLVYVAAQNGVLYALDRQTGLDTEKGWRRPQGELEDLQPLVAGPAYDPLNKLIVAPSEDGRLYSYIAGSGEPPQWGSFNTGDNKIWSTPVIKDGVAYFGSHDHSVYAVNLSTGEKVWQYETGGVVAGKPLIIGDLLIAGSFDKKLYALNLIDGSFKWEFESDNWFWGGAATNGATIFAPSMDGNVYALDTQGVLKWQYDAGSPVLTSPVVVPNGLVVAGKEGRIVLLDLTPGSTGLQRVRSTLNLRETEIKSPLIAVGESVYLGSEDSTVRRIRVSSVLERAGCTNTRGNECD